MKKLVFSAIAIFAVAATMSFAASKVDTKPESAQINDCWSDQSNINVLPPDLDQEKDCPLQNGTCCYQLDPAAPTNVLSYARR